MSITSVRVVSLLQINAVAPVPEKPKITHSDKNKEW